MAMTQAISVRSAVRRRAFTFVEVLFAIIILGVGFIMIAGMLPVAIKQGQESQRDLTGRILADNLYATLRASMTRANTPPTNSISSDPIGNLICGKDVLSPGNSLQNSKGQWISSLDARFAAVPFYRRDPGSDTVQLTILTMFRSDPGTSDGSLNNAGVFQPDFFDYERNLNSRLFPSGVAKYVWILDADELANPPVLTPASPIRAQVESALVNQAPPPPGTDFLVISNSGASVAGGDLRDWAEEGAYVLVSGTDSEPARNRGRIFQLGRRVNPNDPRVWTLNPARDLPLLVTGQIADRSMSGLVPTVNRAEVTILGRGLRFPWKAFELDTNDPDYNPYVGRAQDIGVQTYTFTLDR
jgi:type II secretory pathway pseudopilin PulG